MFRAFSGTAMRDFKVGAVAQRGTGCVGGLNTSKAARKLGDPSGVQSRPVQWGGFLADSTGLTSAGFLVVETGPGRLWWHVVKPLEGGL